MAMNSAHALSRFWRALTPALRRRFVAQQFISLFMAMSTAAGLAGVMTFLAVLADPTLIETHATLQWLAQRFDVSSRELLVGLGWGFTALLLLSAIVNVVGSRLMANFVFGVGDRIREMLFADYLRRDYLFHAKVGAGRLMDNVLNQVDRVTGMLLHGQQLVTNIVLMLLVVISIALVNPMVAAAGVLAVAGCYLVFYGFIRRRVARHGQLQAQLSTARIALVQQALLGIRYLQVARAQPAFDRRFAALTRSLSHSIADTQFIGIFPKYVLECAAGATLIACAGWVGSRAGGGAMLAQLSFIGFAGLRLLPAFQQIYNAFVAIRSNHPAFENLAVELGSGTPVAERKESSAGKLALRRKIELVGVSFRYSSDTPLVLAGASLSIPAGVAVGIMGASGCGKTTLVDLVLGLLVPNAGHIEIDGAVLDANRVPAWQNSVGYVPQDVLILDATLRENIAFGVDPAEIDDARVRVAAHLAGASEFIEALSGGYDARMTGAGGGLSGGQRQRIGIARALYRQPTFLVLDEATNALDTDTEAAIIDAVVRNRGSRTLLVVAHDAAVINACDRVYELRDGKLHARFENSRATLVR
jgi:HlyD family secretion protein